MYIFQLYFLFCYYLYILYCVKCNHSCEKSNCDGLCVQLWQQCHFNIHANKAHLNVRREREREREHFYISSFKHTHTLSLSLSLSHTHVRKAILVRTLTDIMHFLAQMPNSNPYPNLNPNLVLTLKPSLNPQKAFKGPSE